MKSYEFFVGILHKILPKLKCVKHIYWFIKGCKYPICIRLHSSDLHVYSQVFWHKEYSCLDDIPNAELIIDCGGYTGLSSVWFLNRFRNAHIITIEPDPGNFSICSKNLKPYRKRVTLINSAIWPYKTGLVISRGRYGDGREWTTQVRERIGEEESNIQGIDIYALIKKSMFEKIDILKIDIERSEIELFSHDYEKWLDKVKNIAIELHGEECSDIFFKALSGYDYDLSKSGELTVCKNIKKCI